MEIKYNYPHAFFLSIAIPTLIFGFYPFYMVNFDFSIIHWTKILIHSILIIISIVCIWKGLKLWGEKELEKKELAKISREKLQIEIEYIKDKIKIDQLELEKRTLESSKGKGKDEMEKNKERLEKLKDEIKKKLEEREKAIESIYKLQKQEVSKIPDNYFLHNLSGATVIPASLSLSGADLIENLSKIPYERYKELGIIGGDSRSPIMSIKTCPNCKKSAVLSSLTDKCPFCHKTY